MPGPGSAIRTLTLLLTADTNSLNSTLYRSSLEVSRFQASTVAANEKASTAQLRSISQRAAADERASAKRIAAWEKDTLLYAKQQEEEILIAKKAAVEKEKIQANRTLKKEAKAAVGEATVENKTALLEKENEIRKETTLEKSAIAERLRLKKAAFVEESAIAIAAAEEQAAAEVGIAEATAAKNLRSKKKGMTPAVVGGQLEAEVAASEARLAASLKNIEKEKEAKLRAAMEENAVEKTEAANTQRTKLASVRTTAKEQLAIVLDEIEEESLARIAAVKHVANLEIAEAEKASLARREMNARYISTAANNTRTAESAVIQQTAAADVAAVERQIAATERHRKAMQLLHGSLLAVGLASAVAVGASLRFATEFEGAMRNVASISTQLRGNEQALKDTSDAVAEISTVLPKSATDLAKALYEITSAGFNDDTAAGLKVLDASAKAATAGLASSEVAAKGLTEVLNAYGLKAEEAGKVSDVLFQTVNLGVLTFDELSKSLGTVLGTAASAQVSIEQVGAAIAAITRAGIHPEEATTSLARVLTSFIAPTKELTILTKSWGFETAAEALKANGSWDGLHSTLMKVQEATKGDLAATYALFPEKRALRGVLAALSNEGRTYQDTFSKIGVVNASAGSTAQALKEQMKSLGSQLKIMRNQLEVEGLKLANPIVSWVKEVLPDVRGFATEVVGVLAKVFDVMYGPLEKVVRIGQDTGKILAAVAEVAGVVLGPAFVVGAKGIEAALTVAEKILGFFAKNETAVKLLAAALTTVLIPALARTATLMAANTFAAGTSALAKLTNFLVGSGTVALQTQTVINGVEATVARNATGFAGSMAMMGESLSALGASLLAIAPYVAVAVGAYMLYEHLANRNTEVHKKWREELGKTVNTEDLTTTKAIEAARTQLDAEETKLQMEIAKKKYKKAPRVPGVEGVGFIVDLIQGSPDEQRARDAKALADEANKSRIEFDNKAQLLRRQAKGINRELQDIFKLPPQSTEAIDAVAKKLGIDLTEAFDKSGASRDRLAAYFKDELGGSMASFGLDISKMSEQTLDAFIEMSEGANKFAKNVAKAFYDAFNAADNYKFVEPEKFDEKALTIEKRIAATQKRIKALQTKEKTGGTTANEQDALTAATIRTQRAEEDLTAALLKRDYVQPVALLEARKAIEDELRLAKEAESALQSRRAQGDKTVTDTMLAKAHAKVTDALKDQSEIKKKIYLDDEKIHDATTKSMVTKLRKQEDAARALAIAQRKATDNPYSQADAEELARLQESLGIDTKKLTAVKIKPKTAPEQLQEYYQKSFADAKKFNADITKLIEEGVDTELISKILLMGPKQAKDMVDALAQSTKEQIAQINKAEKEFSKLSERASYIGRLTFIAQNAPNTALLDQLKDATRIQDAILNAGQGKVADINYVKKATGLSESQIKEITKNFGILYTDANGMQKPFESVVGSIEEATSKADNFVTKGLLIFDRWTESVKGLNWELDKTKVLLGVGDKPISYPSRAGSIAATMPGRGTTLASGAAAAGSTTSRLPATTTNSNTNYVTTTTTTVDNSVKVEKIETTDPVATVTGLKRAQALVSNGQQRFNGRGD